MNDRICDGCTTPAILCPNANEPKDKVKECASKNNKMLVAKEPAPKVTDDNVIAAFHKESWEYIITLCVELGMPSSIDKTIKDQVVDFIRSLAQRAGEEYSVPEIISWIKHCNQLGLFPSQGRINDPQDGIKAVTERKGG
jgi:hypothetical protein